MSSFERHCRDLRALVGEHVRGELRDVSVSVLCDGCGVIAIARNAAELASLTEAWTLADELGGDDFCPACTRARTAGWW